jgi:proliferating cell nuclear antigen PCNA|tara:strand:- start:17674 stop:18453 length:780 start_codon:yes stop_codon:yes gene_type:complete
MEIVIQNPTRAEIFTTLFQHMKLFTENMNIHFNTNEVFIQAMDNAHVSIFEIKLPSEWFDTYNVESDTMIGINTNILFKVLHTREKSHTLRLVLEEGNSDKLEINLLSENTDVYDRNYVIPLVDIDSEIMGIPEMEYQAEIAFPSTVFSTLIDQMNMFGDSLNITCSEEKVEMNSESVDTGKMFVNIPIDDLNSFAIEEGENLDMSFSLSHLKNICLYSKISKEIEVNLTRDYPIKLIYTLDHENAKAMFYLAPKIDND